MRTNLPDKPVAKALGALPLLLLLAVCLAGCKTSRMVGVESTGYLSSKVQLTIPHKDATLTVNGTMKLKDGERMQLSFLMPLLRAEVARMEVTPEGILLVDRVGKRYMQATRKELRRLLPRKADFARLEKLLHAASTPGGKKTLTGKELGFPSMEKGRISLSEFSNKEFAMSPTRLTDKYRQVELEELLELLMSFQ